MTSLQEKTIHSVREIFSTLVIFFSVHSVGVTDEYSEKLPGKTKKSYFFAGAGEIVSVKEIELKKISFPSSSISKKRVRPPIVI